MLPWMLGGLLIAAVFFGKVIYDAEQDDKRRKPSKR